MVYSALLCSSSSIAQPYDLDRRERFRALGDADLQPTLSLAWDRGLLRHHRLRRPVRPEYRDHNSGEIC